ncbi:4-(cytidine 5'-diphospho)-2-C-methyl-D-erythritol kinase [soil metagenome]
MSARRARVEAHAKLNLRLKVLAREANGFHFLETVFVRVALSDIVHVKVTSRGHALRVGGDETLVSAVGPAESNLALRAAQMYADITGWPAGFEIEIEKHIPVGAGLGGGSADAGAVLRALQALSPEPVAEDDLLRIAASLGSDVPFLTTEATAALAWGRGERMLQLPPFPEQDAVLLTPGFSVRTSEAYDWLDATGTGEPSSPAAIPLAALTDWPQLQRWVENDFEVAVMSRHPEIAQMRASLARAGAMIARMSGSGSTVFGIFDRPPDGSFAQGQPWQTRFTRTLSEVVAPAVSD